MVVTLWHIHKIICILQENISTSRQKDRVRRTERNTEGQIDRVRRQRQRLRSRDTVTGSERLTNRQPVTDREVYGFPMNPGIRP